MTRPTPRRGSGLRLSVLLLALLALTGCDRGASGPGYWEGVVEGPVAVGSAFLAVHGPGVEGVEGADGSMVFDHAAPGEGSIRVVLVAPEGGGALKFRVRVADRGRSEPTATLVELFDRQDQRIQSTEGYRVEFSR